MDTPQTSQFLSYASFNSRNIKPYLITDAEMCVSCVLIIPGFVVVVRCLNTFMNSRVNSLERAMQISDKLRYSSFCLAAAPIIMSTESTGDCPKVI